MEKTSIGCKIQPGMQTELVFNAKATLGEGPAWDAKSQSLYWIDILERRIHAGSELLCELDDLIGCVAPCKNGHLIVAKKASFVDLDPGSGRQTLLAVLESEPRGNRLNDGKCDPVGRLIAGSMDMNERESSGKLYTFNGRRITPLLDGITISNGLAWSPDLKIFYYIDTPTREIQAFDYDTASGEIANRRVVVRVAESLGWPDGMTSDLDGNLWVAMWGGAQITKWNPGTGQLLEQIPVPALLTSACTFGGPSMNELYVTSARRGLTQDELKKYPLSGGLFKIRTKTEGLRTFEFG